jgi:hypothetical protein
MESGLPRCALAYERFEEVNPVGIAALDQIDFPLATLLLEFLLPLDGIDDVVVGLKPNQKMNPISRCESANGVGLVLVDSADQIISYADVERSMLSAGEDINVVHNSTAWGYGFRARRFAAPRNDRTICPTPTK